MSEKNGQFVILNVKLMKNRPEEKRLYWQTPAEVDLGNPVSLIYKLPVSYSPDLHKTVHRCPGICEPSVYRLGRLIKGGNGVVLCKSDIKSEYVENTMMQELPEFFQRTVFQNFHRILGDG